MFDRKKYKQFAKMQLSKRWFTPVIMTLICFAILFLLEARDFKEAFMELSEFTIPADEVLFTTETAETGTYMFDTIRSWITILVEFILMFAQLNVYLAMSKGPEKITLGTFVEGLGMWVKAVLAGLWNTLWVFLWSMLFLIPGIVKFYAYSQMFYLLAEFPELSVSKAMKISIEITRGHKGDLFVMHLSFIGWAILAAIPVGLGYLWLMPYINMSMTNAYHGLLKDALSTGVIKLEDLKGTSTGANGDF
ncbi:MAG: DUF975 family protein [Treponema porcinum]|nr:DUF975 family protein [Treponema porcinum]